MSADRIEATLGEIAETEGGLVDGPFGSNLPASGYVVDGVPVIRGSNLSLGLGRFRSREFVFVDTDTLRRLKRSECLPDDIVFTKKGTLGQTGLVPEGEYEQYLLSSNQMRLRVDGEKANALFVYYFVSSDDSIAKIKRDSEFTGVPKINLKYLKKFPIFLPNLDKQLEIAEILGSLDNRIELNRQTNQTLEQIAQAIFKSWFIDFEPVKAKQHIRTLGGNDEQTERAAQAVIVGAVNLDVLTTATDLGALDQQITEALKEKLTHQTEAQREQLTATATHFSDRLVGSKLGLIPEGWEVSNIGEEVAVVGGGTPSTKNDEFWAGGNFNWTTPKDLSGLTDKILLRTERRITQAGLNKISSGLLPINTVLMSSRAPVGYLALAKIPVAINQGYIAMKCTGRMPAEYVIQWANFVMDDIKQRASGTTFAEISKKNFRVIPLVVPVAEVAQCYSSLTGALYQTITEKMKESFVLTEVRDSLLPKLLSGELAPNQLHQIHN